jgi:hypothetical protein
MDGAQHTSSNLPAYGSECGPAWAGKRLGTGQWVGAAETAEARTQRTTVSRGRLNGDNCALLLCDIQERFRDVISGFGACLGRVFGLVLPVLCLAHTL